jgi:hypothetical protein
VEREFGLHLGSGTAIVGGCEDFRSPSPAITTEEDHIRVEPSWYRVRVHINRTEDYISEGLAYTEADKALTPEELERYRQLGRHNNTGCSLYLGAVALGIGAFFIRGVAGLVGGALAVLLMAAGVWRNRRLERTDYHALHQRYVRATDEAWPPAIVLELHRAEGPLPGGFVRCDDEPPGERSSPSGT